MSAFFIFCAGCRQLSICNKVLRRRRNQRSGAMRPGIRVQPLDALRAKAVAEIGFRIRLDIRDMKLGVIQKMHVTEFPHAIPCDRFGRPVDVKPAIILVHHHGHWRRIGNNSKFIFSSESDFPLTLHFGEFSHCPMCGAGRMLNLTAILFNDTAPSILLRG